VTARAGMHGPLVNHHQIQKCTWTWPRRRTVRPGPAENSVLADFLPADGVEEVQVSGTHRELDALPGRTPPRELTLSNTLDIPIAALLPDGGAHAAAGF
jgi:hypothetical protein